MAVGRWPLIVDRLLKSKSVDLSNYKDLDAWKIAMQLVSAVYQLIRKYPKEEMYGMISQLKRAAISVPCNIAEGIGRQYKRDTIQFLHIARGSLYEIETLIHISMIESLIDQKSSNEVLALIEKNLQILNGFINYLKRSKLK